MMTVITRQLLGSSGVPKESNTLHLPCRGCTKRCENYSVCEGRLWRTLSDNT